MFCAPIKCEENYNKVVYILLEYIFYPSYFSSQEHLHLIVAYYALQKVCKSLVWCGKRVNANRFCVEIKVSFTNHKHKFYNKKKVGDG
jgi:hypothetical protein